MIPQKLDNFRQPLGDNKVVAGIVCSVNPKDLKFRLTILQYMVMTLPNTVLSGPYCKMPIPAKIQAYDGTVMATDSCLTVLSSSMGRKFIQNIAHVGKLHL